MSEFRQALKRIKVEASNYQELVNVLTLMRGRPSMAYKPRIRITWWPENTGVGVVIELVGYENALIHSEDVSIKGNPLNIKTQVQKAVRNIALEIEERGV